jgi:hypothetical protein
MHKHRRNSNQNTLGTGITEADLGINGIKTLHRTCCGDVERIKLAQDKAMMSQNLKYHNKKSFKLSKYL